MRYILILSCLILSGSAIRAQNRQEKSVMVLRLDSMQFFSDAFYLEELAELNGVKPSKVPIMYSSSITQNFLRYNYEGYSYFAPLPELTDSARSQMQYKTLTNEFDEAYLGMAPLSSDQSILDTLISSRKPDYILSLNLYEILALKDSTQLGDKVLHSIHYDIFTSEMGAVHSGQFQVEASEVAVYYLDWLYMDFALDVILWIKAWEKDGSDILNNYTSEIDEFFRKETTLEKKQGIGFVIGTGMPYGGLGLEYVSAFSDHWDWNIGMGFDFNGFKVGTGFRYYILGAVGTGARPFVGFNYGYASGLKFKLGAERDDYGTIINPDDVTKYHIFSDHALYLQFGLNIRLVDGLTVSPTMGYSYPFNRRDPEIISGPENYTGRNNFVRFMAVGGLSLGLTITGFY